MLSCLSDKEKCLSIQRRKNGVCQWYAERFLTACFWVENLIFFNSLSIFYYVYWILSVQSESDLLSTDFQIGYIGLCLLKAWRNKNCKYIWQVLLTELNVLTINLMASSRRQVHTLTQFLHFMSILSLSIYRINMYIHISLFLIRLCETKYSYCASMLFRVSCMNNFL